MTIFAMTTMIILLCLLVVVSTGSDSIVTLQTRLGNIKGISSTFTLNNITKPYTIFRNIPFAQVPIGELRFRKPVPYGSWNGTLDATQFGPSCVQSLEYITEYLPNKQMSEDCLVLNAFCSV
jgi:carboxylesterase type B